MAPPEAQGWSDFFSKVSTPIVEDVETFPRIHTGLKIESQHPSSSSVETQPMGINTQSGDPFAAQTIKVNTPFGEKEDDPGVVDRGAASQTTNAASADRRMSKEWDASKVPPSRFQKREGSIYATQGSRDGRVEKNLQSKYLEKLKEKKWS